MLGIAELYFSTVGEIVEATDCDIIGHFDLLTKFNEGWGFGPAGNVINKMRCGAAEFVSDIFDTSDERYAAAWKKAIDRIFDDCESRYKKGSRNRLEKYGILEAGDKPVFEINTGAISRGYRTTPYPSTECSYSARTAMQPEPSAMASKNSQILRTDRNSPACLPVWSRISAWPLVLENLVDLSILAGI